uniref:FERM domain-containing protein n=1 Tax=Strongyloides papillosus TaxID=174720 RepID=A0A0N5BZM2_STREA
MVSNLFNKFYINFNGYDENITGTGFNISLDELKESLYKKNEYFNFKSIKILRFVTIANFLFFDDDSNCVTITDFDNEIKMTVKNAKLKTLLKNINYNNDYEGLLIFLTYEVSHGFISEFILQEVHMLYNFSEYMEQFYKEMFVIRRILSLNLFSSKKFIPFKEKTHFPVSSSKETYIYDNISQSLYGTSVFPSSCNSTPRSRPEKTLKMFLKKFRKNQLDNARLKTQLPESEISIEHNKPIYSNQLNTSDVIGAVELGIMSSINNKIEIEAVKNFLGITKLELVRHLFKLNHLYEFVEDMTNIKKI